MICKMAEGEVETMKQKKQKKEVRVLRQKASLTVECAVVLPLFFFAVVILAGLLDSYRITTVIQSALCESAKELGMYAYCQEDDTQSPVGTVSNAVCQIYAKRKVQEKLTGEALLGVVGGVHGINLAQSVYENGRISLKASFFYQAPFTPFQTFPVRLQVKGQARAWIGYNDLSES